MAATLTLLHGPEVGQLARKFIFKVVLTSNYPTGGETLNFAPYVSGDVGALPTSVQPERFGGYVPSYIPGASISAGKLKQFSAPGTELAAGAYPAALLALTDARIVVELPK